MYTFSVKLVVVILWKMRSALLVILHDLDLQADCLDDLAFAIMQEMSKLSYRVTEEDVIRARN